MCSLSHVDRARKIPLADRRRSMPKYPARHRLPSDEAVARASTCRFEDGCCEQWPPMGARSWRSAWRAQVAASRSASLHLCCSYSAIHTAALCGPADVPRSGQTSVLACVDDARLIILAPSMEQHRVVCHFDSFAFTSLLAAAKPGIDSAAALEIQILVNAERN